MEVFAPFQIFLLIFFLQQRYFLFLLSVFEDGVVEFVEELTLHLILLIKLISHILIIRIQFFTIFSLPVFVFLSFFKEIVSIFVLKLFLELFLFSPIAILNFTKGLSHFFKIHKKFNFLLLS